MSVVWSSGSGWFYYDTSTNVSSQFHHPVDGSLGLIKISLLKHSKCLTGVKTPLTFCSTGCVNFAEY